METFTATEQAHTCSKVIPLISPREQEILNLIAYEKTGKEIASELYISNHTVISHRKNLMEKLDVRNTAGMVRRGFELGLLRIANS